MTRAPTPRHARTASGDVLAPTTPRLNGFGTASLIAAASAVFLWPTLSPLSLLLLGPVAWALGTADLRRARAAGYEQLIVGSTGRSLGKLLTLVCAAVLALPCSIFVTLFLLSWLR